MSEGLTTADGISAPDGLVAIPGGDPGPTPPEPPPFPTPPTPWVRPECWLPLPEIAPGDQIFAGLFAIFPENPNYVALTALKVGQILSVVVAPGTEGTGYAVDDEGYIDDGNGHTTATYRVTAVGVGGAVESVVITSQGEGYTLDPIDCDLTATTGAGENGAVNITALAGYTVDWGDGTTEDFDGGVTAEHAYDYDTYDPGDETLCVERGYKQAVITVTPQAGSDLTFFGQRSHSGAPGDARYAWLEVAINSPALTALEISQYWDARVPLQESVWLGENAIDNATNLFDAGGAAGALQSLVITELNSATEAESFLYEQTRLRSITLPNLPLCTTLYNAFYGCTAAEYITIGDCPLLEDGSYMCEGASALRVFQMGQFGALDGSANTDPSGMFTGCFALTHAIFGDGNQDLFNQGSGGWFTDTSPLYLSFGDLHGDYGVDFNFAGIDNPYLLEYIRIGDLPDVTSLANVCSGLLGLRIFEMGDAPLCEDFSNAWNGCDSLESWLAGDMSAATTMASAFQANQVGASAAFVLGDFPLCTDWNLAFWGVASESITIGDIDGSADFTDTLTNTFNLLSITVGNIIGATFPSALFASAPAVQEITVGDGPDVTDLTTNEKWPTVVRLTLGDYPSVTNFDDALMIGSGRLQELIVGDTSGGTSFQYAISDNDAGGSLVSINAFDTSNGTDLQSFAYQQHALQELPAFDFSSATLIGSFVEECYALARSQVFGARVSHSYAGTNMQVDALVEVFENLGDSAGPVDDTTVVDGGADWVVADTFELASPTGGTAATCTVDTVSSGAITAFTVDTPGTGFVPGAQIAPSNASGTGTGGLIEIVTTGAGDQTINVSNTPGALYLTAAQIAIAEAKGWTVTLV